MAKGVIDIADLLRGFRFTMSSEAELQAGVAEVLSASGLVYNEEHRLGNKDRIDFYLSDLKVGIELKVDGGTNQVADQLLRYAQHDEIAGLVLVTTKAGHRAVPPVLNGKPILQVKVYEAAL